MDSMIILTDAPANRPVCAPRHARYAGEQSVRSTGWFAAAAGRDMARVKIGAGVDARDLGVTLAQATAPPRGVPR